MKKSIKAIIHYTEYYSKSVDDEAAIQTKERNVADSDDLYLFSYEHRHVDTCISFLKP